MGIKHFYSWFRKHKDLKHSISSTIPGHVDHLLIDMNGVIHEAAQIVFKYGKYAPTKSEIIIPKRHLKQKTTKQICHKPSITNLFDRVKDEVNKLVDITKPKQTLYLAIDGVAPMSKQNQQRQRRFRAAKERGDKQDDDGAPYDVFDSTCITAGTQFMRQLAQSLDGFKPAVPKCIISDDSQEGEGEHKLMEWIRHNGQQDDIYCVVGMDADLVLLCTLLKNTHVYIMRETDQRNNCQHNYDYIDISVIKQYLPVNADDLLIWSCFVGNDFLPPIPSLEIKESAPEIGAFDFFFDNYRRPLVDSKTGYLNNNEIIRLLKIIRDREQAIMEARLKSESGNQWNKRFANPLWQGNIDNYRLAHRHHKLVKYKHQFNNADLVYDFMKTVQWVYFYYTRGIQETQAWDWFYPYNYALHADSFVTCMENRPILSYAFKRSTPSNPYEQLLRVIPVSSKNLIPAYLHEYADQLSAKYSTFEIDKSGKRQEWEAVTIVDFVHVDKHIINNLIEKHNVMS